MRVIFDIKGFPVFDVVIFEVKRNFDSGSLKSLVLVVVGGGKVKVDHVRQKCGPLLSSTGLLPLESRE